VRILQQDDLAKLNDSTRMNQLMMTATLSPSLNFSGERHQHTVNGSVSYTKLDDRNPVTRAATAGDNINSSLDYSLFFTSAYWGLDCILTYSQYGQQENTYRSMGVNAGMNAQFLKTHSLSVQGSVGYFINHDNGAPVGNNTTFSFNGNYEILNHSLGVFMSYVITPPVNLNPLNIVNHVPYAVNSRNLVGGVTYAYHF
jgi:hypothetical protein